MFRILLLFSGLLGGLALAQITRERHGEASTTGSEPDDGPTAASSEDDGRQLVAVMVAPVSTDAVTEATADPREAVAVAAADGEAGVTDAPATAEDATDPTDATDEATVIVEAVAGEAAEIDVAADDLLADDLEAHVAAARSNRRVRALVIGGVAAAAGLAIGFVAIRRVRPDLLTTGAIRAMLPAIALPAITMPSIARSAIALPPIELPVVDGAKVRRLRLPAFEGGRLGSVAPAVRSVVASAVASAIATSLARRLARR